jgi:hypothetical protein
VVSKVLLTEKSGLFASMFKIDPSGHDQYLDKTIITEVVTFPRSVEEIILWLYRGVLLPKVTDYNLYQLRVSQLLELANLAEYWKVCDPLLEDLIITAIKEIALPEGCSGTTTHYNSSYIEDRGRVYNTRSFTDEHLDTVFALSSFQKLKDIFIMATVESHIGRFERDGYRRKLLTMEYAKNRLNEFCVDAMATEKAEISTPSMRYSCNYGELPKAPSPTGSIIYMDSFSGRTIIRRAGFGQAPL